MYNAFIQALKIMYKASVGVYIPCGCVNIGFTPVAFEIHHVRVCLHHKQSLPCIITLRLGIGHVYDKEIKQNIILR